MKTIKTINKKQYNKRMRQLEEYNDVLEDILNKLVWVADISDFIDIRESAEKILAEVDDHNEKVTLVKEETEELENEIQSWIDAKVQNIYNMAEETYIFPIID